MITKFLFSFHQFFYFIFLWMDLQEICMTEWLYQSFWQICGNPVWQKWQDFGSCSSNISSWKITSLPSLWPWEELPLFLHALFSTSWGEIQRVKFRYLTAYKPSILGTHLKPFNCLIGFEEIQTWRSKIVSLFESNKLLWSSKCRWCKRVFRNQKCHGCCWNQPGWAGKCLSYK